MDAAANSQNAIGSYGSELCAVGSASNRTARPAEAIFFAFRKVRCFLEALLLGV